jgi:hypothetical protein
LTALVEHARTAGFQVGKLSRRIEVDGEKAPDSAKLARVGLSGGFEAAGPYLFSLSSSIAHGSGLGIIEMSEVTSEARRRRPNSNCGRSGARAWI